MKMTNKIPTEELYDKALDIVRKYSAFETISDLAISIDKDGLWVGYFTYGKGMNDKGIRGVRYYLIQKDCFYSGSYRVAPSDTRPSKKYIYEALETPTAYNPSGIGNLFEILKEIAKLYDFDIGVAE